MRRFAYPGLYLCILAVWMQILAPAAAMPREIAFDPFSVICTGTPTDKGTPAHHPHQHDHCLLCQAGFSGPPLDDRVPSLVLGRVVVHRLRWRQADCRANPLEKPRAPRSRGPPSST